MSPQFKRMSPVPRKMNGNKSTTRHIVIKLQNMKDTIQKLLRAAGEKRQIGLLSVRLAHLFIIGNRCQKITD